MHPRPNVFHKEKCNGLKTSNFQSQTRKRVVRTLPDAIILNTQTPNAAIVYAVAKINPMHINVSIRVKFDLLAAHCRKAECLDS